VRAADDGVVPIVNFRRIPLPEEAAMQSAVVKRSIVVAGHKTSVSLEDEFWNGLKDIGKGHKMTLSGLVANIDKQRRYGNLSSAIRLFVLDHFRMQISGTSIINDRIDKQTPQLTQDGQQPRHVNGRAGEQSPP
jgi:predicted DNA-binding ribbon-helix-helix protein